MAVARFEAQDWQQYKMDYHDPHRELEPPAEEIAIVDAALGALRDAGILDRTDYDSERMLAHREMVRDQFEIPWTAITPRVQRLLYAVCAISRPPTLLAAGIFCGNTFISCAGAALGEGACYAADRLIGVEIDPERADLARRNLAKIDPDAKAEIRCEDAVKTAGEIPGPIDLLYLDADGTPEQGKGVYLDILRAALDRIPTGGLIVAHNSVNAAERLVHYLAFVRDPANCRGSVNVVLDGEGVEVSIK